MSDFGLSKVYGLKDNKAVGGTPFYMSPEALNEQPPDEKSDVYAYAKVYFCNRLFAHPACRFGIILWELVTGKVPYSDEKFRPDAMGLAQLYMHVVEEGKRLAVKLCDI